MQITHIGHASLLVETRGLRILSDPWWRGPCFGAQWWLYPRPHLATLEERRLDYIYISHGHEDHFHPGTLKTLDRSATLLVSTGASFIPEARALGFPIMEIAPGECRELAPGVRCRIQPTHDGDTFFTLDDGETVVANLNDALHALPGYARRCFIRLLRRWHPRLDYVFCGYAMASHFPNCYRVPGKDHVASLERRQRFFSEAWADIIHDLSPRFGFPFAASVVLLEEALFWSNAAVHNMESPARIFQRRYPRAATTVLDIEAGFTIADGEIIAGVQKSPLDPVRLREDYRAEIVRANRLPVTSREAVTAVADWLGERIQRGQGYFAGFTGDYRLGLRFRDSTAGIAITKCGKSLEVTPVEEMAAAEPFDLLFTSRLGYLRRALTTPHGADIMFVGSGGIFEYPDERRAGEGLHEELILMLSDQPPGGRWKKRLKRMAKTLLDRDEFDLYNLQRWLVRRTPPTGSRWSWG